MGGLSKDPAKAERQRAALAAGRRKLAEQTLAGGPPKPKAKAAPKPKAKAPAKASKGTRASAPERVTYDDEEPRAPRKAKPRRDRERRDDPPRRGGGFLRGLRGQLD